MLMFQKSQTSRNSLSSNVADMRSDGELFDCNLIAEGQSIPCHKLWISAQSPVLRKIFITNMKESSTNEVNLPFSYEILSHIIDYFYTGVMKITEDLLLEILQACDYLGLEELKDNCVQKAPETINVNNVIKWGIVADKLYLSNLVDRCIDFLYKDLKEISRTDDFKKLTIAGIKDIIQVGRLKAEPIDLFICVLEWVQAEDSERKQYLEELMEPIKITTPDALGDVSQKYEKMFESYSCLYKFTALALLQHKRPEGNCNEKQSAAKLLTQVQIMELLLFDIRKKAVFTINGNTIKMLFKLPDSINVDYSVSNVSAYKYAIIGGRKKTLCMIYNHKDNTFEDITPMPRPRKNHFSCFIEGKLYVLGGYVDKGHKLSMIYMDINDGIWSGAPNTPHHVLWFKAVSIKTSIFTLQELNSDTDGTIFQLHVFCTRKNTWSIESMQDLPFKAEITDVNGNNEKVFLVSLVNDHYRVIWYSLYEKRWFYSKLSYPSLSSSKGISVCGEKVIILSENAEMIEYDASADTWNEQTLLNTDDFQYGPMFCIKDDGCLQEPFI